MTSSFDFLTFNKDFIILFKTVERNVTYIVETVIKNTFISKNLIELCLEDIQIKDIFCDT